MWRRRHKRRRAFATARRLPDCLDPRSPGRARSEHAPAIGRTGPVRRCSPAGRCTGPFAVRGSVDCGLPLGRDRRPSAAARTNGRPTSRRDWAIQILMIFHFYY